MCISNLRNCKDDLGFVMVNIVWSDFEKNGSKCEYAIV